MLIIAVAFVVLYNNSRITVSQHRAAPTSISHMFRMTSEIHNYRTRSSSDKCFYINFRTLELKY